MVADYGSRPFPLNGRNRGDEYQLSTICPISARFQLEWRVSAKKKKKFHLCNLEALLIAGPCFTQSNVNRLVKNTWGDSMQRNMDQYKSVDRSNLAQYSNLSQSIKLTPTLRRMSAYNFVFHNLLTSYRKLTASAIRKTEFCKRQIIQISFSELVRV